MLRILTSLAPALVAGTVIVSSAVAAEPALKLGPATPFSFDTLIERARALAAEPYKPEPVRAADTLEKIDYDAHWKIRFKPSETITIGKDAPIQFFHMGRFFKEPVHMYEVGGGQAREILYSPDAFDMPDDSPAKALPHDIGFAGFRVMRPDLKTDWISYLGASYFRTDGQSRQYGQSTRGLAINTGLSTPEEFPRFSDFWLAPPEKEGETLVIYALLRSPSVTGAYKMALTNADGKGQVIDIDERLFFRKAVERLGVAPADLDVLVFGNQPLDRARLAAGGARHRRPRHPVGHGRAHLASAQQPARRQDLHLPGAGRGGLRACPARPKLRGLPGRRRLLRQAPLGLDPSADAVRARLGPARGDPDRRRDLRQYRRLLDAEGAAQGGQRDVVRLSHDLGRRPPRAGERRARGRNPRRPGRRPPASRARPTRSRSRSISRVPRSRA